MLAKNNPFNIRTGSRWIGYDGSYRGFCKFKELEFGVRAACVLIMRSYRKKGICRIQDIILRYAPPSENSTESYISYVCKSTGFSRIQLITTEYQYAKILSCMAYYESITPVRLAYILHIINKYNIKVYEKV